MKTIVLKDTFFEGTDIPQVVIVPENIGDFLIIIDVLGNQAGDKYVQICDAYGMNFYKTVWSNSEFSELHIDDVYLHGRPLMESVAPLTEYLKNYHTNNKENLE